MGSYASLEKPLLGELVDYSNPETNGLIGAWLFNEGSGGRVPDASENSHKGILTNMAPATDWVIGEDGPALDFSTGTTRHVKVSDGKITNATSGYIEVVVTIKTLVNADKIFSYGGQAAGNAGIFGLEVRQDTNWFFSVVQRSDGDAINIVHGDTQVITGRKYHVILVSNGLLWRIYVDGRLEILTDQLGANNGNWIGDTAVTGADETQIGGLLFNGVQGNAFNGHIPFTAIGTDILTDNQVAKRAIDPLAPFRLAEPSPFFVPVTTTIETVVINTTIPLTTSPAQVDITSPGFGTPDGVIAIMTAAHTGSSDTPLRKSVGWAGRDGLDQSCGGMAEHNVGITNTSRHSSSILAGFYDSAGSNIVMLGLNSYITDGVRIGVSNVDGNAHNITYILFKNCVNIKGNYVLLDSTNTSVPVGFKPNLVYAQTIGHTGFSTGAQPHLIHSLGAAHNNSSNVVTQGMVALSSPDGQVTEIASTIARNDAIAGQFHNGSMVWQASIENFNSSGFDIDTGAVTPNDYLFYLAIDTGDPNGVDVSIITPPTSTGLDSVTAPGFYPQHVNLFGVTAPTVNTADTVGFMGEFYGSFDAATEGASGITLEDAATTTVTQSSFLAAALYMRRISGGSSATLWRAALNNLNANGYTLNYINIDTVSSAKWLSIALRDLNPHAGLFEIPHYMRGGFNPMHGGFSA